MTLVDWTHSRKLVLFPYKEKDN